MAKLANVFVLVCAGALAACEHTVVQSTAPRSPVGVSPERVSGPFVQASATFTVRLSEPIGTRVSHAGEPFSAIVETPLRSEDGAIVVPRGARLSGHVVAAGPERVRVAFDAIDTVRGEAPIAATIDDAQQSAALDVQEAPPGAGYQAGLYQFSYPGTAPAYVGYAGAPREIVVPTGAAMRLRLTRPLVPPGSHVTP